MTNRAFFWVAVLALMLGGALGGVLIVVLDDGEDEAPVVSALAGPSPQGPDFERLRELTGRIEAGDVDAEDLEELEEVVSELPVGTERGPVAGDVPGGQMIGAVESLEGGVLAVDTPIGPLQTAMGEEAVITVISESEGALEDLTPGLRITLEGQRNEDGLLEAAGITVVPEGLGIPLGGRLAGRQSPGGLAGASGGLSEQELAALSLQAAIMAAQARGGGGGVEVMPAGPPARALANPGERRTFSFQGLGRTGGAAVSELTGVLESVDDGVLELTTPRGPVRAAVGPDTTVTIFSEREGGPDDLTPGALVVIAGQPGEVGSLEATAITVLPEALALPIGRAFGGIPGGPGAGAGFGWGQGGGGGGRPGADR